MKMRSSARCAVLSAVTIVGLGWSANHAASQDKGGARKPAAGPTPEEMKAWMDTVTPGEPHKKLARQVGNYVVQGRTWMDRQARAMDMKGTASIKMILGGRYQVLEFEGDSMGMRFEGTGLTGYDNVSKEYFSTWVDTMRTGIVYYRGKANDKGVVTMTCEFDDPMNPTVRCTCRQVVTFTDEDHFSSETWMKRAKDPEEFKAAEMSYARKE